MILRSERSLPLELPLLPLAQQLLLEVCHRLQEVFASHVRGRNDDAAVQEFVDAIQEVLSVMSKIGNIVETLRGNTITWHHLNATTKAISSYFVIFILLELHLITNKLGRDQESQCYPLKNFFIMFKSK